MKKIVAVSAGLVFSVSSQSSFAVPVAPASEGVRTIYQQPAMKKPEARELTIWQKLRHQIEMFAPKKKLATTTTAVAGVRGSQADADDVYWKGETSTSQVEVEDLSEAIAMAESRKPGAKAALEAFLVDHPGSIFTNDVNEAILSLGEQKLSKVESKPRQDQSKRKAN